MSNSLRAYGVQPARLLCPWDFPGKNTGVGGYFLLQGIFLTQRLNSPFLHWQVDSSPLSREAPHTDWMGSNKEIVGRGQEPGNNARNWSNFFFFLLIYHYCVLWNYWSGTYGNWLKKKSNQWFFTSNSLRSAGGQWISVEVLLGRVARPPGHLFSDVQ